MWRDAAPLFAALAAFLVDAWLANSAAQAFRSRAKRNALPVRVCKRGTFVYLEAI